MRERVPPIPEQGRERKPRITHLLQDTLASGFLVIDEREEIVACNPEAEQIVGFPQTSALSRSCSALPTALQEIIKESMRTRRGLSSRWITPESSDEAEHPVAVSTHILQQPGAGIWVIVVLSEPSIVLELESRLQRLNRLASSGTLSASLAHEIKNTLVAIKTFVETLVEKHRDEEMAQVAAREFDRIQTIVGQMLRFSGTAPVKRVRMNLNEILDQSLRLIQHGADEKSVTIQREFSPTAGEVSGDTYQLEQAFINLFLNALAAMEPGGWLQVSTENIPSRADETNSQSLPNPGWTRVVIVDSGKGIPRELLERVFEPFFTTKADGTGLGLSIARRIVQEHGGLIAVESKPGVGTRFKIELPLLGSVAGTEVP